MNYNREEWIMFLSDESAHRAVLEQMNAPLAMT
jgi:hypothetical protein